MKKFAITFFIFRFSFFVFHLNSMAQGCLPEGIIFETQAQIDSFQINYPGCTEIIGDVTINGEDITNFNGLSTLNSFGGDLIIGVDYGWNANPALENLTGLENLVSIGGELTISGNSILADLSGLDNLSATGGSLSISNNPSLTTISNLGSLNSIGGALILGYGSWLGSPLGNPVLESLDSLQGITSLAGLQLIGNHALTDLSGLNNLQSVSGGIIIGGNGALSSLAGLEALANIGGDLQFGYPGNTGWVSNPSLLHLTGLEGLTEIGGTLAFLGSALVDLEGLSNLVSVGNDLLMEDNYALPGIEGLNNLETISGNLLIGPYPGTGGADWSPGGNPALLNFTGVENLNFIGGDFVITMNFSLSSLSGFENLASIGGNLIIYDNDILSSISGLENIEAASIENLEIDYNDSLAVCEIQAICDYLADPNGTVEIHNNAPGCNSQEEVDAACAVGIGESSVVSCQSSVICYPNPTGGIVNLQFTVYNLESSILKVYNAQGQEVATVLEGKCTGDQVVRWDAGALPAGIYYYLLSTVNCQLPTLSGKIVKY